jgi:hypothetical protein
VKFLVLFGGVLLEVSLPKTHLQCAIKLNVVDATRLHGKAVECISIVHYKGWLSRTGVLDGRKEGVQFSLRRRQIQAISFYSLSLQSSLSLMYHFNNKTTLSELGDGREHLPVLGLLEKVLRKIRTSWDDLQLGS